MQGERILLVEPSRWHSNLTVACHRCKEIRFFESRVGAQDLILEKITSLISLDEAKAKVSMAQKGLPLFDSGRD